MRRIVFIFIAAEPLAAAVGVLWLGCSFIVYRTRYRVSFFEINAENRTIDNFSLIAKNFPLWNRKKKTSSVFNLNYR